MLLSDKSSEKAGDLIALVLGGNEALLLSLLDPILGFIDVVASLMLW